MRAIALVGGYSHASVVEEGKELAALGAPAGPCASRHVLILGAGYGGLRVALRLEKVMHRNDCEVLLIDQNDYHQYIHRIHEVAGGRTDEKEAVVPIPRLIRGKKIRFIRAKVLKIDPSNKLVETDRGTLRFDILVVALGSDTQFFGIKGLEEHSLTLRSVKSASEIRKRVEEAFVSAQGEERQLRFIVGGGGFCGTELAGELAEWLPLLARKHGMDPSRAKVVLVEMKEAILPEWNPKLAGKAAEILRSRGVELVLGKAIVEADEKGVLLSDGRRLEADLIVWVGGICGVDEISRICPVVGQRAPIDEYSEALGFPGVYVVGDCALVRDAKTGKPLPASAHIAMEQGDVVAENIYADLYRGVKRRYVPKHVGEVVSLGSRHAVGDLWGIELTGIAARMAKKLVHLAYVYSIGGFKLLMKGE